IEVRMDGRPVNEGVTQTRVLSTEVIVDGPPPGPVQALETFSTILRSYPGAQRGVVTANTYEQYTPTRWGMEMTWPSTVVGPEAEDDFSSLMEGITGAPYRFNGHYYLRPSVTTDAAPPPSPLMTWWALLYAFSMLSRYEPRFWTRALNVDKSENAAYLEYGL